MFKVPVVHELNKVPSYFNKQHLIEC